DRLYRAGRELVALDAQQLSDLDVPQRVDLIRNGIRRLTHDLLQYEMIDVRVLDQDTGVLRPLLQEGMTPEAARRELRALPEGNGVTGFVAATGKSYLCPDT